VVVVLTLALGIGANTAIFRLIDALMLRWLAFTGCSAQGHGRAVFTPALSATPGGASVQSTMRSAAAAACLSLALPALTGRPASRPAGPRDPAAADRATRLVPIAAAAWSGSSVNVVADQHHTLFSHGRVQYAAFYAPDGRLVLARRAGDEPAWESVTTPYSVSLTWPRSRLR
jgi:hypothetical protein